MEIRRIYIILLLLLSVTIATISGERILLLCYPMRSHTNELRVIGEELVRRGHEVYAIVSPALPGFESMASKSSVHFLRYEMKTPDMYTAFDNVEPNKEWMEELIRMTFLDDVAVYNVDPHFPILPFCTNPLSDEKLFKTLQDLDFDLAIVDAFMQSRCLYILPYKLGIPYVSETTQFEPWLMRNPALPSFVPWPIGTCDYGYTDSMTFWQRLYNVYSLFKFMAYPGVAYLSDDLVRKYAPEKPFMSLDNLAAESQLWLMCTDVILDFPRPSMPNMVEVGGLSTKPAEPLDADLEQFVSGATHGVVVVSFGSLGSNLPDYVNKRMMDAFRRIPQRVVWAVPHDGPQDLPENIRIMNWIPQNDLLGHNNTKLFITHCGANGQFESLSNAVPMISMPLFGEQPYNALRGEYRKISVTLNVLEFTSDELVATIKRTIEGPYQENIKKLSTIFNRRPMKPVQRAAHWVEHVLEFGGGHMRSHAVDMPWYQYMMLDILLFLLSAMLSFCVIIYCCVIKICCKRKLKED